MFFKSKKNAAEYDAQRAIYFLRTALAIQNALYKEYGRDDLAVEIVYADLQESEFPEGDTVPVLNRPYIYITNTERDDDQETETFRLNIDEIFISFPSVIGKDKGMDERWHVRASNDCIMTRSVAIANDTTSDRMLMRLITTVNALI